MPSLAELESTHEHTVFTGTEGDCSNFAKLVKVTVAANELPLSVEYRAGRHGLPNKWLVRTKMLPKVAHTVAALSQGGKRVDPVTGDEVLQFLRVQEGNLREWIDQAEKGLRPMRGKGEREGEELGLMPVPHEQPVEPGIEV
jgi:hypothetical protein